MTEGDRCYVGEVSRRMILSSERARQLMDEGRFGPVQRDALGYRYVDRAAVEVAAIERARREKAGRR